MKKFLLGFFVIASISVMAQSGLEKDLIGNWSVVAINRLDIPREMLQGMTVEELRNVLLSMRLEFRDDHYLRIDCNQPDLIIPEAYWVAKGNSVAAGDWEQQGKSLNKLQMEVQQRDGRWFFSVAKLAELEVRKD